MINTLDSTFWHGRRVFLTGHTGFKGSWLALWLESLGAHVHGFALAPPTSPSLHVDARVAEGMTATIADVRDADAVATSMRRFAPEVVLHLAAQPLVRRSYLDPFETYSTNVMGTVNVLEAARHTESVRAIVNVTTDKCYENKEWVWGYREDEPMGGHDPYSSSKGCSELITSAYRDSFFAARGVWIASARSGNVIGGGDWATDRLVPDILRAFERKQAVQVRNPLSIRPWQHVLEPLSGYLLLAQQMIVSGAANAEAWNFGPRDGDARTVQWIVERLARRWGRGASWTLDASEQLHEAHHLKLDIGKATARLGWSPRWNLGFALEKVVEWHEAWLSRADAKAHCLLQIEQYMHTPCGEAGA